MPRPYSDDLRERVVGAVESGRSRRSVAAAFDVSVSFVIKLMLHWKVHNTHKPLKIGGYRKGVLDGHRDVVVALVAASPDMTLAQMRSELAKKEIVVSIWTIHRFLKSLEYTVKKNDIRQGARAGRCGRSAPGVEGKTA